MKIEFGELRLDNEVRKHFEDILRTSWVSGGPKVKMFEDLWGELFDYKYNVGVSNGTAADQAACMTLYDFGAKKGDEIITPALAFAAVGNSIIASGFKPSFVDVEKETMNIDPKKIEEKINKRTKAIMCVHTMGKPCNMNLIQKLAKDYNLKVIEDSCEAHGAKYHGKFIGKFGDLSTFSYYAAHLISCGDGGMVSTNNPKMYEVLKSVKSHGRKADSIYFDHERYGLNFRMNDLVASIGIPQIKDFFKIFDKRKKNLNYLLENTRDLKKFAYFNNEEKNETICPHAFSIILKNPKYNMQKLYHFLEDNSIRCKRNFGSMPTQHKAFKELGYQFGEFPNAEYIGDNGLHIGVHNYLEKNDLDYILENLHDYFKKL